MGRTDSANLRYGLFAPMMLAQGTRLSHTPSCMGEQMVRRDQVNWRMPLYAVLSATLVMLLLFVYDKDPVLSYLFLIVPLGCLAFLILLVVAIIKRTRKTFFMLLTVVAFVFAAGALLKTQTLIRPSLRWLLWSRHLKAEVLAQPTQANEELKHIEWDGWGGAPVGDWTVYVVYDPTDSLSDAAKIGWSGTYKRYKGVPCEVESVRRLESHWYSVVLGMN